MISVTSKNMSLALLLAAAGFATMAIGDALVKSLAGQWPAYGVAALRFVMATVGLGVLILVRGGVAALKINRPWLQFGRGAAIALASVCFFLAAMSMPLADATAILFTSPMITAVISSALTRELPSKAVFVALAAGLVGVLLVLRPNLAGLEPVALLPLAAAVGMSLLMIFNRMAAGDASPLVMQFQAAVFASPVLVMVAIALESLGAPASVSWPSTVVIITCAAIAVVGTLAHLLIYVATVNASAAAVSPMAYAQLLMAALLGWLFFGNTPDLQTVAGAALIIGGGLWLWRSQTAEGVIEREDGLQGASPK